MMISLFTTDQNLAHKEAFKSMSTGPPTSPPNMYAPRKKSAIYPNCTSSVIELVRTRQMVASDKCRAKCSCVSPYISLLCGY